MKIFLTCLTAFWIAVSGPVMAQNITDHGAAAQEWLVATRKANNRAGGSVSVPLTKAAADHASDMAARGFFSHTGSDKSSVGKRVKRQGYGFCFVAENIAKGQKNLSQVMESWMSSDGHRRNILASEATEFGLVSGPGNLWVMVLGRPGC